MQTSKSAFTMIELIFVIVILGVLAAVAIPKIAVTRTDAQIATTAQNIVTGAGEIAAYAVSNGTTQSDLSVMSNAVEIMVNNGSTVINTVNKTAIIQFGSIVDCVSIQVVTGLNDDNLTITFGNGVGDSKCLGLQSKIDAQQYPMQLRGGLVKE